MSQIQNSSSHGEADAVDDGSSGLNSQVSILSAAQKRIWNEQTLMSPGDTRLLCSCLALGPHVGRVTIEDAVNAVYQRHKALQTSIQVYNGKLTQTFETSGRLYCRYLDLSQATEKDQETERNRILQNERCGSFSLKHNPLLRATLISLGRAGHYLILTVPYLIADRLSLMLIQGEISSLCRGASLSDTNDYAEFLNHQQDQLTVPISDFWSQYIGSYESLNLPFDSPVTANASIAHSVCPRFLPGETWQILQQVGKQTGIQANTLLLAVFKVLLARYCGSERIVLGMFDENLAHRIQTLVGLQNRVLPIATTIQHGRPVRESLTRVGESLLQSRQYPEVSFEEVLAQIQCNRSDLFQVMFHWQDDFDALEESSFKFEVESAHCNLALHCHPVSGGVMCDFHFDSELFTLEKIDQVARHFLRLAEAIAEPDTTVAELPILTNEESRKLVVDWNATAEDYPRDKCVHELFADQAKNAPQRIAVQFRDDSVTYDELDRRANQLARYLIGQGVNQETLVGVCTKRSPRMLIAVLGILKAGGAYVPLDPNFPQERIEFMLEDSSVKLVLTEEDLEPFLSNYEGSLVRVDTDEHLFELQSGDAIERRTEPENLCYVIYTSGSTGNPKGVQVPHRALTNFLITMGKTPGLDSEDVLVAVTTLSFDISALELYLPLIFGAKIILLTQLDAYDARKLSEALSDCRATIMQATPATWRLLLENGDIPSGLKILCGGEPLPSELARSLLDRDTQLWNVYGPTETTVWSTICQVEDADDITIGRPIANTELYIVDDRLQIVPPGVPGELLIGGDGLARGYLNRDELTQDRFIENPWNLATDSRVYRTGDLARYRGDGVVEHLGRIDNQVKIRGFRIELGEIESVLSQHVAISQCVVHPFENAPGSHRLSAYYMVADGQPAPHVNELREFLGHKLPEYMIPSAFTVMGSFPLTPNGKVNRKALPAPDTTRPDLEANYVAPQNELERFLASLWIEELHIDRIGIEDNFFDLGGDSLKAASVVSKVQEKLGEFLYVVTLFDAPTIAGFARFLASRYEAAIRRVFDTEPVACVADETQACLIDDEVDQFRALVTHSISQPPEDNTPPIPRSIFVLCAPRSGSTLLRVMLAGNPHLFSPPELDLLGFETLQDRDRELSGRFAHWAEGTIRALMELKDIGPDDARDLMQSYIDDNLSCKQFFAELQRLAQGRMLVDKSTTYAIHRETLDRAERIFEDPFYVHLLRNPGSMTRSFKEVNIDQIFLRQKQPFEGRKLAELIWLICQENISRFLESIPNERKFQLKYEDLVSNPEQEMRELCETAGLDFCSAMITPYKDKKQKMTDGIHSVSLMLGDMKFHTHSEIDPSLANSAKDKMFERQLGESTRDLAIKYGYQLDIADEPESEETADLRKQVRFLKDELSSMRIMIAETERTAKSKASSGSLEGSQDAHPPMFLHAGTTVFQQDVESAFRDVGLREGDTCLVHSSLYPFGQPIISNERLMDLFIESLKNVLGPTGTLVMPTYTFDFCNGKPFDVNRSKSTCGVLTEYFRTTPGVIRTTHPIYSHAIFGARAKELATSENGDCFGQGTIFENLLNLKAKAMSMGSPFPSTFKHYVEQAHNVPYRYLKTFDGIVIDGENRVSTSCNFFVRCLDDDLVKDSAPLAVRLIERGLMKSCTVGGATILLVAAEDFYNEASEMLQEDIYALMKHKNR